MTSPYSEQRPVELANAQQRDADLAETVALLNGPNPCDMDMNLPSALTQDGGQ